MNRLHHCALLFVAAVLACSSPDREAQKRITVQAPTDSTTAHDSMSAHADTGMRGHAAGEREHPMGAMPGMRAMPAGHQGMKPGQHAAMPGMRHGQAMAANPTRHDMSNMPGMRHDSAAGQQHAMPSAHDTMRAMQHAMPSAHDTMAGMKHDTMAGMRHDTMPGMKHDTMAGMQHDMPMTMDSEMLMGRLGTFTIMAMAQAFPTYTFSVPSDQDTPLSRTGFYLTQPAIMTNISSPGERIVLRTTLNFEGMTQPDGELTFGTWGEGFIDKRHPHTLLHEFMLSWNHGTAWKGYSLSAGKGFAPYGTADPMSRPVVKYPTNHHLSQALERWTVNGIAGIRSWGLEAAVFGGQEPIGPYDFSNINSFGDSWSARVTKRFGQGQMGTWPWEIAASHAAISEQHEAGKELTRLYNVSVRHEQSGGNVSRYAMLEASVSQPENGDGNFAVLGEAAWKVKRHQPYARVEYSTRPEYARAGPPTSNEFFRYDHDSEPIGATRWLILTGGYGWTASNRRVSPRPYIEAQYNRVRNERGDIRPEALFGRSSFFTISAGVRVFLGGEPMRMGTYGVLDPMTAMHSMPMSHAMRNQ